MNRLHCRGSSCSACLFCRVLVKDWKMGNVQSSRWIKVDENGHRLVDSHTGPGPYNRLSYRNNLTTVEVTLGNDGVWTGTQCTLGVQTANISVRALDNQFAECASLDDKIAILRDAPDWQRFHDVHAPALATTRPTAEQRQTLRSLLSSDQYAKLAVALMEREP